MSRKHLVLTLASLLCCILLFTAYPSIKLTDNITVQYENKKDDTKNLVTKAFEKKGAFATMLCDPKMIEPTLVSLYTLNTAFNKKPSSRTDVVVLIAEDIYLTSAQIQQFKTLNTHVIRTSLDENENSCNSVINLWALLDYQRVVYFTPEVLFENNVDQLFNYPAGSAIYSEEDGKTEAPLFVLEPSSDTFDSLVKDYRSVSEKITLAQLLDHEYIEYQLRIPHHLVKNNLRVLDEPMKPWNFHEYKGNDWIKSYDPLKFYKWRQLSNDVRELFNPETEWTNKLRQASVCDAYVDSRGNKVGRFFVRDKFSVLLSTYNPERIEHVSLLIRHLLKSKKVHTVYITWHNPNLEVPPSIYQKIKVSDRRRVKVLPQTFDSLNNRFNPIEDLRTESVYILDDDIYVDIADLELTFDVWRNRKNSVVGHFPRLHTYDAKTHEATYNLIGKAPYTIVLTKSMFIRSEFLFGYTCLFEPKLHQYVDDKLNCEDLGFMMMASGVTGSASTFVLPKSPIQDFGLTQGISINNSHMPSRSQCISDFITNFWHEKDPLIEAYDTVSHFSKATILVGDWDAFENPKVNQ